jgi:hypothetical protein
MPSGPPDGDYPDGMEARFEYRGLYVAMPSYRLPAALAAVITASPLTACQSNCKVYVEEQKVESAVVARHSALFTASVAAYYAALLPESVDGSGAGATPEAGSPASIAVSGADVTLVLQATCADGSTPCVSLEADELTLTLETPRSAGTFALSTLAAVLCELVPSPPAGNPNAIAALWQWAPSCTPVDGTIDVHAVDVACDDAHGTRPCTWFVATLSLSPSTGDTSASMQGTLSVTDGTEASQASCPGLGSFPAAGS